MKIGIFKPLLVCFILIASPVHGKDTRVVIAYSASEAFQNKAYTQVIEAVEKKIKHVERFEMTEGTPDIQTQLDQLHPDKIIALGKQVAKAISLTTRRQDTVVGMAYFKASEYSGVGLALDSQVLITHLSRLVPFVKRVFIIQDSSLQTIDKSPVADSMPSLVIREGSDIIATIRLLGKAVEQEAKSTDVVFLPANLPKNILYEIARIAWDKGIILMSTNLAHLDSGALMAFYPDDTALGEQLSDLMNKNKPTYESIRGVNAALNKRVAQHLNIDFDQSTLTLFKLTLQ
jgi:hypothetical protein